MRVNMKPEVLVAFAGLFLAAYSIQEGHWWLALGHVAAMCAWLACADNLPEEATRRVLARLDGHEAARQEGGT